MREECGTLPIFLSDVKNRTSLHRTSLFVPRKDRGQRRQTMHCPTGTSEVNVVRISRANVAGLDDAVSYIVASKDSYIVQSR